MGGGPAEECLETVWVVFVVHAAYMVMVNKRAIGFVGCAYGQEPPNLEL